MFTYEYQGKQYVGVYSGIGGWAGIGMAAGLEKSTEGLGAVGGYKDLAKYTTLGGSLFIFALPAADLPRSMYASLWSMSSGCNGRAPNDPAYSHVRGQGSEMSRSSCC